MPEIEFVPYPPTSFPYRDVLLLEQMRFGPGDRVCEVGVGSGQTASRLARLCEQVTGVDISAPTIESLRYLERLYPNLRLEVGDVTRPEALAPMAGRFTRVVSCDTLEHVSDPAAYFRAIAELLVPGGHFLVTFPNEPAEVMHGITRFDRIEELEALLEQAGLTRYRIGAARLEARAEQIADTFGWRPLRTVRNLLRGTRQPPVVAQIQGDLAVEVPVEPAPKRPSPQTFDETRFYRNMRLWRTVSPLVNLYWFGVLRLMVAGGRCFDIDWTFQQEPFTNCQILIAGQKGTADDA